MTISIQEGTMVVGYAFWRPFVVEIYRELEASAIIKSVHDKRIVGCPGDEGVMIFGLLITFAEDEHDVVWFWLEKGNPHECPGNMADHLSSATMSIDRVHDSIASYLTQVQSGSTEVQEKFLRALVSFTKVSSHNRNSLFQIDGAIPIILSLSRSSSTVQLLSLSILFNLSLNSNLRLLLADLETIHFLNSIILNPSLPESSKLAASIICSLAMLDKNKAKFGVGGTIQALIKALARPRCSASHYLLSSLAELVQFHGNCTLAVRTGAVPVLSQIMERSDGEDLSGTSLSILSLFTRYQEGMDAIRNTEGFVNLMVEVLKRRCMLSKEGSVEILIRLFEESEDSIGEDVNLSELSSLLADLSVQGSAKARDKADALLKIMMEADLDSYMAESPAFSLW